MARKNRFRNSKARSRFARAVKKVVASMKRKAAKKKMVKIVRGGSMMS